MRMFIKGPIPTKSARYLSLTECTNIKDILDCDFRYSPLSTRLTGNKASHIRPPKRTTQYLNI